MVGVWTVNDENRARELAKLGVEPMPMRAEDFDALVAKEVAANETLAKAAGIGVK